MTYEQFLKSKQVTANPSGFTAESLNPALKPFQAAIVKWALKGGRRAIFADTGLGKTLMQLEWANQVSDHTGGQVLVLAPLAVAEQTAREAMKFGIQGARVVDSPSDDRIQITNYEKLHKFNPASYKGVVLDESSILKGFTSTYRKALTEFSNSINYRLPCSATPAPNDYMELGNHAEYLGVMSCTEMLAMFFTHDGGETSKWRLKGHAQSKFWQWVASWAVAVRKPSDIGFSDDGYDLPPLHMEQHVIASEIIPDGKLFAVEAETLQERQQARKGTIGMRVDRAASLVNNSTESWIVWCGLNDESKALAAAIPGAVEVTGSDSDKWKVDAIQWFTGNLCLCSTKQKKLEESSAPDATSELGNLKTIHRHSNEPQCTCGYISGKRVLVSKPVMMGFGLNFQACRNMAFVGLSDSYEQFYQAVRRCWRFGQDREVYAHVITTDIEGAVVRNIERKDQQSKEMMAGMVEHMKDEMAKNLGLSISQKSEYGRDVATADSFTAHWGDSIEVIGEMPDNSIHYSIYSPPFSSLYTYSNSDRDMGNCRTYEEFMDHFSYLAPQLYRVLMPGRLMSFHCMNLPLTKERDGVIGLRDFRGILIKLFQDAGFIFHSEVCIWKDPVTAMQRTKAIGLLYKQLRKDSSISRQGIPDYLVTMRKPGENPERITKVAPPAGSTYKHARNVPANEFAVDKWQQYASPVWMDIDQSDTLNRDGAREEDDERHICPLQLGVIHRGIELWTNQGDTVLSPFMGIGSEGYESIRLGRKFIGCELKRSYWELAVKNLRQASNDKANQATLFDEEHEVTSLYSQLPT